LWHEFRCRAALLVSLALGLTAASLAAAAPTEPPEPNGDGEVTFTSDFANVDPETGELVARGDVVMLYQGYRLEAQLVRYNERTGLAVAEGGVTLTDPDGAKIMAPKMELNGPARAGIMEHALLIMAEGERLAASRAQRFADGDSRLDRAVFSPCPACQEDPTATPIWQIAAVEVIHDRDSRRLIYDNAFLEVFGVPVAWLPYFSHPDPTVDRASGFLIPQVRTRDELGAVFEIPYHWAISESQDATLTPIFTTKESPALAASYRHHLGYGRYSVSGAFTFDDQPSEALTGENDDGLRGFIFSDGRFVHGKDWQSTYQLRWASDDTFLRIYDFTNADTLISNYKLEGILGRTYIKGEMLGFKGLRLEDVDGLTAHALPLIDINYLSKPGVLGGSFEARLNAVSLLRTDGADTRRATLSTGWRAPFTSNWGHKVVLDAYLEGAVYDVRDADNFDDPAFAGDGGTELRGVARASATISWPFSSFAGGVEQIIEPVVQLVASPEDLNDSAIPNEDSRSFALGRSNLFSLDRTPGFDLVESGSRVTYGLRYKLFAGDFSLEAMAGQSLRSEELTDFFPEGAGATGNLSDVVGEIGLTYKELGSLVYQVQLDQDNLSARRHEVFAETGNEWFGLDVGYVRIERGLALDDRIDREEIRFNASVEAVENWTLFGGLIHEIQGNAEPIEWESGVLFNNDCCLELGVTVRKRFTRDRDVEPGTSVILRIRLRNLG